jgi:hypothetical protein
MLQHLAHVIQRHSRQSFQFAVGHDPFLSVPGFSFRAKRMMGAGTVADVDPKISDCVSVFVAVEMRLALRLGALPFWPAVLLPCSWRRVFRCIAYRMARGFQACCCHLCQSQSGDQLRWPACVCTNGTGVYRPGWCACFCGTRLFDVGACSLMAWGFTAALRLA